MKTICLFSPGILPIPAVKGGAIETLINILIDENEIEKKVKFIIISNYDPEAVQLSEKYQFSRFIFIKDNRIISKMYSLMYRGLRKIFKFELPFSNLYYYKGFKKAMKENIDSVIAEGGSYEDFKYFTKKLGKENVYLHLHHHFLSNSKLDNVFGNVIAVSEFVKNEWIQSSSMAVENVLILRNCIDEKKFGRVLNTNQKVQLREKLGLSENDFVVLYCGRVIQEKGVKELILSINRIVDDNVKLLITGSPNFALTTTSDYLQEIECLVNESSEKIKFTGYIDNEEIYKFYNISDIAVIPSLCEEAAPLVAIEAMTASKPLIVTDSGGMPEYITGKCAIVLKRDDKLVNNIATTISQLKNNNELVRNMSINSKERSKKYSTKTYYGDFISIIRD